MACICKYIYRDETFNDINNVIDIFKYIRKEKERNSNIIKNIINNIKTQIKEGKINIKQIIVLSDNILGDILINSYIDYIKNEEDIRDVIIRIKNMVSDKSIDELYNLSDHIRCETEYNYDQYKNITFVDLPRLYYYKDIYISLSTNVKLLLFVLLACNLDINNEHFNINDLIFKLKKIIKSIEDVKKNDPYDKK